MKEDFVTAYCMIGCEDFGVLEALLKQMKRSGERVSLILDLFSSQHNFPVIKSLVSRYDNLLVADAIERTPQQKDFLESRLSPYYNRNENYLKRGLA